MTSNVWLKIDHVLFSSRLQANFRPFKCTKNSVTFPWHNSTFFKGKTCLLVQLDNFDSICFIMTVDCVSWLFVLLISVSVFKIKLKISHGVFHIVNCSYKLGSNTDHWIQWSLGRLILTSVFFMQMLNAHSCYEGSGLVLSSLGTKCFPSSLIVFRTSHLNNCSCYLLTA